MYDIQVGDKIVNLSSNSTYEKVTDIKIIDGKAYIYTKEYYENTDSLVSEVKCEWAYDMIKNRLKSKKWKTHMEY